MLPEYEVELLHVTLTERERQVMADVQASALRVAGRHGPNLFQRLYALFRVDPGQTPASQPTSLRTQGYLSR